MNLQVSSFIQLVFFYLRGKSRKVSTTKLETGDAIASSMHKIVMHAEQKPYKCRECDKIFKYKSNLWTQMKRHTEEKPHKCTECDKIFTWNSKLRTNDHVMNALKLSLTNANEDIHMTYHLITWHIIQFYKHTWEGTWERNLHSYNRSLLCPHRVCRNDYD